MDGCVHMKWNAQGYGGDYMASGGTGWGAIENA